eukprot:478184-Pyramimonas_sp.AAC.1
MDLEVSEDPLVPVKHGRLPRHAPVDHQRASLRGGQVLGHCLRVNAKRTHSRGVPQGPQLLSVGRIADHPP